MAKKNSHTHTQRTAEIIGSLPEDSNIRPAQFTKSRIFRLLFYGRYLRVFISLVNVVLVDVCLLFFCCSFKQFFFLSRFGYLIGYVLYPRFNFPPKRVCVCGNGTCTIRPYRRLARKMLCHVNDPYKCECSATSSFSIVKLYSGRMCVCVSSDLSEEARRIYSSRLLHYISMSVNINEFIMWSMMMSTMNTSWRQRSENQNKTCTCV